MNLRLLYWFAPLPAGTSDGLALVAQIPSVGAEVLRSLWHHWPARHPSHTVYAPADCPLADTPAFTLRKLPPIEWRIDWAAGIKRGLALCNLRHIVSWDRHFLSNLAQMGSQAVIALDADPHLKAPFERVRLTAEGQLVGFRRVNRDGLEPDIWHAGHCWPALVYFPPTVCQKLVQQHAAMPLDINRWSSWLDAFSIPLHYLRVGAAAIDLTTPEGVIGLLEGIPPSVLNYQSTTADIDPTARLIGPIWLGDQCHIAAHTLIIGPAIIADGASVQEKALVHHAVVLPHTVVPRGAKVHHVIMNQHPFSHTPSPTRHVPTFLAEWQAFRDWPIWSYPRFGKRLFDILFSLIFLVLVSPVMVAVAILIKLTSPGPIFYIARRQGLHGKEFGCIKFRTMIPKADALQEHLRDINQVDGPQFKIENDPRTTPIGKFLRETCIDELPQFINVLLGQMSVVGPRPSPESENQTAPVWRDARLSVRPGITGLWQVCRTRQAAMDFQEWIFYDVQYVRNLSFRKDLWICWKTAAKLIKTFLDQFG